MEYSFRNIRKLRKLTSLNKGRNCHTEAVHLSD